MLSIVGGRSARICDDSCECESSTCDKNDKEPEPQPEPLLGDSQHPATWRTLFTKFIKRG